MGDIFAIMAFACMGIFLWERLSAKSQERVRNGANAVKNRVKKKL